MLERLLPVCVGFSAAVTRALVLTAHPGETLAAIADQRLENLMVFLPSLSSWVYLWQFILFISGETMSIFPFSDQISSQTELLFLQCLGFPSLLWSKGRWECVQIYSFIRWKHVVFSFVTMSKLPYSSFDDLFESLLCSEWRRLTLKCSWTVVSGGWWSYKEEHLSCFSFWSMCQKGASQSGNMQQIIDRILLCNSQWFCIITRTFTAI